MPVAEGLQIADEVRALCEKFGVEYESVLEITIRPGGAEVIVAKRNDNERFYVESDGGLAKATLEYSVNT